MVQFGEERWNPHGRYGCQQCERTCLRCRSRHARTIQEGTRKAPVIQNRTQKRGPRYARRAGGMCTMGKDDPKRTPLPRDGWRQGNVTSPSLSNLDELREGTRNCCDLARGRFAQGAGHQAQAAPVLPDAAQRQNTCPHHSDRGLRYSSRADGGPRLGS